MTNKQGANPLLSAIQANNLKLVRKRLAGGDKPNDEIIFYAFKNEKGEAFPICQILIEKGANIYAEDKGSSLLCLAAERGEVELVNLLLEEEEKQSTSHLLRQYGQTAFVKAVESQNWDVAQLLLEKDESLEEALGLLDEGTIQQIEEEARGLYNQLFEKQNALIQRCSF